MKVANRLLGISYAIRDIYEIAQKVAKTQKVHYLNIGDPGIFPETFNTPKYICDALSAATYAGHNEYANSLGVEELRQALCAHELKKNNISLEPDDFLVTQGVSEGIMFINAALIENGDEFLSPGPGYPTYKSYATLYDGVIKYYKLDEENGWDPDIESVRKNITDKTQAILISSPNNPTGSIASPKKVKEIIDIAGEHDLVVISDEIYDKIILDDTEKYVCPASMAKDVPVIGMNGFSKAHMSTGWRLGYMFFHDPDGKMKEVKENIEKLARIRLCANTPAQYAAIESYTKPSDHTVKMVENLRLRCDYAYKRIQDIDGMSVVKPKGAFYMFPKIELGNRWKTDKDFVLDLLKNTGVCTVFGSGFGDYGEGHVRMTLFPSLEEFEEIFNKIENFLK